MQGGLGLLWAIWRRKQANAVLALDLLECLVLCCCCLLWVQLKMWVEKGKEAEALAEKEKLNAPPPSVGSISAASSSASLAAMSETGADKFARCVVWPRTGRLSRCVSAVEQLPARHS